MMEGQFIYGDNIYCDECYAEEMWADIPSFPGYKISDMGRVWSTKNKIFLKPKKMDRAGHLGVILFDYAGRRKYLYLHRLVAQAFVPNPNNYPIVRHMDDVKDDNSKESLIWGTQADNIHDSIRLGNNYVLTTTDREKSYKKCRMSIRAIDIHTKKTTDFISQQEASRTLNIPQANIYKVLKGERKRAGNYIFERRGF